LPFTFTVTNISQAGDRLARRPSLCHDRAVTIRAFLQLVYDALPARLPAKLRKHQWRIRWSLLQVYFESAAVHYEVWVQKKTGRIEIGLHFESADPDENYRWAAALAPRMLEVQSKLGPGVELEEWTRSWTRLHESMAFEGKLTETLAADVAKRLAEFISTLEPVIREGRAAVPS
jgi:hypothetical protein